MFLIFYLLMSEKEFKALVLNMGYLIILLKLNRQLLEKQTRILKNKNKTKRSILKFEYQSTRSKQYFSLEDNWLDTNFKTRDIYFYDKSFQLYITGEGKKWNYISCFRWKFQKKDYIDFNPCAPAIKYVQHKNNNCVLIILSSALFDTR